MRLSAIANSCVRRGVAPAGEPKRNGFLAAAGSGGRSSYWASSRNSGSGGREASSASTADSVGLGALGAGDPGPAWTDPVLTAGVTPVTAAHMLELREAGVALE